MAELQFAQMEILVEQASQLFGKLRTRATYRCQLVQSHLLGLELVDGSQAF